LNGSRHILFDIVTMLGKNINAINKNAEALLEASREILGVNTEKTKMWLCLATKM